MMSREFARGRGIRTIGLAMLIAFGGALAALPAASATTGAAEAGDSAVSRVEVSLRQPEVPRVGRNRFKVVVEDAAGQPLQDAEVSLTLYRRGVSGSKGYIEHPVQTKVELEPGEQAGTYEAIGPIVASGRWDVKMQVKPRGAGKKIVTRTKIWADD